MAKQIHHINILVTDLEPAIASFSQFLNAAPITESLPLRGAVSARFDCNGVWLVLVSPTCSDSPLNKILEKQGEGVFLLSFGAQNLSDEIKQLVKKGIACPASAVRKGADNWLVQDIQFSYPLNVVMQLCESVSL